MGSNEARACSCSLSTRPLLDVLDEWQAIPMLHRPFAIVVFHAYATTRNVRFQYSVLMLSSLQRESTYRSRKRWKLDKALEGEKGEKGKKGRTADPGGHQIRVITLQHHKPVSSAPLPTPAPAPL